MVLRPDWLPALSAFESAARHQNFAHAAEELNLTASAVSHHVRKLEARLGVVLFQRHARGVTLTQEGRLLADASGSALADMEAALRSLRGGLSPIAMTIGTSLFLIAVCAILTFVTHFDLVGIELHTVGVIPTAVGIFGLLLGLFLYIRDQDPVRRPV